MKKDNLDAPLTMEEAEFAAENHYLIAKYLRLRKLPYDEWYDVVIFRYLRTVKRWFAFPELQQHNFEVLAFYAMRSAIGHEMDKKRRRAKKVQFVSLNDPIPGSNGMTYMDALTTDCLQYQYV